nr:immunoglobulin light chain junction region [Mus musculus]NSM01019.1 immunoglobulin light chain junction region [Mus musculus]NSM03022.1 immunoglobulin light chain junction region [Mus musculus]
CLQHGESPLTF